MGDQYLEFVRQLPETKDEMKSALVKFEHADLSTKAEVGKNLLIDHKIAEKAIQIMGDTIYEQTVENGVLRNMIGNVNDSLVQELVDKKKSKDSSDERNKVILQQLNKTVQRSRQLVYTPVKKAA